MTMRTSILLVTGLLVATSAVFPQQTAIPRIDMMPSMPSPYLMRDWKQVAIAYDSFVFDLNKQGQYLPLAWINTATINYPAHPGFGLHTVVGTPYPTSAEGINCLPAVVGAKLVGIDRTNQQGYNWVLMCEEWFNKKNGQNVYLNAADASTGDDWWYETMPNVFFYQLYSMHKGVGDFAVQFTTVADRWLQAVNAMGGSTTPWAVPNMDHRAWDLATMTPNNSGVREPEAAGAIAWLLYNAFVETGDARYRIGAEQAMEFLNAYPLNPAYELQLSYGTVNAARMNAELGTTYDVEKMLRWCFDVSSLRPWGAIVGTWGGLDCSGLIGEVNESNDYAFLMNTFEQAGALVPLVRYEPRFARAIGKWMLNAANAARLFYPQYLPDANQDSRAWSRQFDSASVIGHEAMRQSSGPFSPFATGDAISGGWGQTNLALYGSSHVGIFGGIIDTTDVPMILRLDVLKTDYFHAPAYPTFLYFNPHLTGRSVALDVGSGQHDVYDAVSKSVLLSGVTGTVSLPIPADGAVLAVVAPSGGTVTYDLERMLVNDVVVDYHSGHAVSDYPPRIKALAADSSIVLAGHQVRLYATAMGRSGDTLGYTWGGQGTITGSGSSVLWTAPAAAGLYEIVCIVSNGRGGSDTARVTLEAVLAINHPPQITGLTARPRKVDLLATVSLSCIASDPDGDTLTYAWSAGSGVLLPSGAKAQWTAPALEGNYLIRCLVSDGHGGAAEDSILLEIRDFSKVPTGTLLAFYPFTGNADDASGNIRNGIVTGAVLTADRFGHANSAYAFDGTTSSIRVPNDAGLNVQSAITVSFWMTVGALYAREQYPISHGNWTNRWKVSISNGHVRWTIKTTAGTKDLDSESIVLLDSLYLVTASYNGADMELYMNGQLDAFTTWSGGILPTTIDLTIGKVLPNDANYNFNGVLDDVRLFDYALPVAAIEALYDVATGVRIVPPSPQPAAFALGQNYPNPFNGSTTIRFVVPGGVARRHVTLRIRDTLGRDVAVLVNDDLPPGEHTVRWEGASCASGMYFCSMETGGRSITNTLVLLK
jgi:hypothetical protein